MTKEELENIVNKISQDFFILTDEIFVDTHAYMVYRSRLDEIRILFKSFKFKDKYYNLYFGKKNNTDLLDKHIQEYMVNLMHIHHVFFNYKIGYD